MRAWTVLLVLLGLLGVSGGENLSKPAASSSLYVSAEGSDDAACTQTAPCQTFARAYAQAKLGQTVLVRAGDYPAQLLTDSSGKTGVGAAITFQANGVVNLTGLSLGDEFTNPNAADNLKFVGFHGTTAWNVLPGANNITFDHVQTTNIYANGTNGYTVTNSDFGNCTVTDLNGPCDNFKLDGDPHNVLIENNVFHDFRVSPGSEAHFECFFIAGGQNVTIRDNRFIDCQYFDIFIQYFSSDFAHVRIEQNWFSAPLDGQGLQRDTALWFSGRGYSWSTIWVNNNSFDASTMAIDDTPSVSAFTVAGNILGQANCFKGVAYSQNIWAAGQSCSVKDVEKIPFGYAVGAGRLAPIAGDAAVVRQIFSQCAQGLKPSAVARNVRQHEATGRAKHADASMVRSVVSNAVYLGGRFGAKGANPQLVQRRRFLLAQKTCGPG